MMHFIYKYIDFGKKLSIGIRGEKEYISGTRTWVQMLVTPLPNYDIYAYSIIIMLV